MKIENVYQEETKDHDVRTAKKARGRRGKSTLETAETKLLRAINSGSCLPLNVPGKSYFKAKFNNVCSRSRVPESNPEIL